MTSMQHFLLQNENGEYLSNHNTWVESKNQATKFFSDGNKIQSDNPNTNVVYGSNSCSCGEDNCDCIEHYVNKTTALKDLIKKYWWVLLMFLLLVLTWYLWPTKKRLRKILRKSEGRRRLRGGSKKSWRKRLRGGYPPSRQQNNEDTCKLNIEEYLSNKKFLSRYRASTLAQEGIKLARKKGVTIPPNCNPKEMRKKIQKKLNFFEKGKLLNKLRNLLGPEFSKLLQKKR